MKFGFYSLRRRLLVPLLAAAVAAAIIVAIASYWLAAASSQAESRRRFESIGRVVEESTFPLTRNVLVMLSNLTSADWYTLDAVGVVNESSTSSSSVGSIRSFAASDQSTGFRELVELPRATADSTPQIITFNGRVYQAMRFGNRGNRRGSADSQSQDVVVMFDDSIRRDSLYRAAAIPLITGLSTVFLLTSIAWFITERLIQRITRLQLAVEGIAQGDFNRTIQPGANDELGLLSNSIGSMAEQLSQMWQALRQRHGQQLLHQISGGLAHNLRNTLTGARMAVELVQRQLSSDTHPARSKQLTNSHQSSNNAGLDVAVSQLEQAEDYVQRLLLVSRGQEARHRPAPIRSSLESLRLGLESTAEHRGTELKWNYNDQLQSQQVADSPTLLAAVSNLVWNAIEAADKVQVEVGVDARGYCVIQVIDNGPGPKDDVANNLFEPFVSSKTEGLGLGLPLVKRAAETLGGEVQWSRLNNHTEFRFAFPFFEEPAK